MFSIFETKQRRKEIHEWQKRGRFWKFEPEFSDEENMAFSEN